MTNPAGFLAAYDEQLRTDAETPSAIAVLRHGPLRLVTFRGGRGFVTYQSLAGADAATISRLVRAHRAHVGLRRHRAQRDFFGQGDVDSEQPRLAYHDRFLFIRDEPVI